MDEPKKCTRQEALKKLYQGAYVFTEIRKPIYKQARGCRVCGEVRKGTFCHVCGNRLSNHLKLHTGTEVTHFRLTYQFDTLSVGVMPPGDTFYGQNRPCTFSLNFFMNHGPWSYLWP